MAYASVQDAIDIHGLDYITVSCDRDGDGDLDIEVFEKALIRASDRIDGAFSGRVPGWPWQVPPANLLEICVNVAVYSTCNTQDVITDIKKERYHEAIEYLDAVAKGKIKLTKDGDPQGASLNLASSTATSCDNRALMEPGARNFTRQKMRSI